MDPLGTFREEHSSILEELYGLDRQLGWLESTGNRSRKILIGLLTGGEKLASDMSLHFEREEKTLYPILERRLAERAEPVSIMRQEHQRLSTCMSRFTSEVARMLKEHDKVKTWELSSCLQDLRSELSDHVSREERVVFWLAEIQLSKTDKNKVYSEIAQMRNETSKTNIPSHKELTQ